MLQRSRILNPVHVVGTIEAAKCYLKGEGPFADRRANPFPTLLLLDVHLPDGLGFDLLHWLNAHVAMKPAAVVVLTGSDLNAFKTSYKLGAHSFLTKPLRFDDFQNMARHVRGIKLIKSANGLLLEREGVVADQGPALTAHSAGSSNQKELP